MITSIASPRNHNRTSDYRACLESGDFERLVRDYAGRLLAVAGRFLRCEDDAADAVQDAFLSAYASRDSFAGNSAVYTWLHRIVVNACLMKIRARPRARTVSLDESQREFQLGRHGRPAAAWDGRAEQNLEREELRAVVRAGIDRLPEDYRTILLLRDIEEFDTDQTAELLGLSRAAVKTRLHRARQALRAELAPSFAETEDEISLARREAFDVAVAP